MRSEAKLDSALWGDLTRLDESGTLDFGEETIDVELVGLNAAPGAMVVTDRRLLFFRSNPITRKAHSMSIPLAEIAEVEFRERRSPIRRRGVVRIHQRTTQGVTEHVFEYIPGGADRARELQNAIVGQRDHLLRGRTGVAPGLGTSRAATADIDNDTALDRLTVLVGRGVTRFVRHHGGRLFVWGEPIGGFEWMKASTTEPLGVDFVRFDGVGTFELYVQEQLLNAGRLRLGRRWLPRPRIMVDT